MSRQAEQPKIDLSGFVEATNTIYRPVIKNAFTPNDDKHGGRRYNVLYGGGGSGKSFFLMELMVVSILSKKRLKILVVRATQSSIQASTFAEFKEYIARNNMEKLFHITDKPMQIKCKVTGSQIIFFGLDDTSKLKSIANINWIWMEEADGGESAFGSITVKKFTDLDTRLRGKRPYPKKFFISFNPTTTKSWVYKVFFKKDDNGNVSEYRKRALVVRSTWMDNRYLTKEDAETFKNLKMIDKTQYMIYCLGMWGSKTGAIYPEYDIVRGIPREVVERATVTWGIDFGYSVPAAAVLVFLDEETHTAYIHEVLYARRLTQNDINIKLGASNASGFLKAHKGYGDSAEPDRIKDMQNYGFNIVGANKSVSFGIDMVKRWNLAITSSSRNIIEEIEGYRWKVDQNGDPMDVPVKADDHAMDALRYAIVRGAKDRNMFLPRPVPGANIR